MKNISSEDSFEQQKEFVFSKLSEHGLSEKVLNALFADTAAKKDEEQKEFINQNGKKEDGTFAPQPRTQYSYEQTMKHIANEKDILNRNPSTTKGLQNLQTIKDLLKELRDIHQSQNQSLLTKQGQSLTAGKTESAIEIHKKLGLLDTQIIALNAIISITSSRIRNTPKEIYEALSELLSTGSID